MQSESELMKEMLAKIQEADKEIIPILEDYDVTQIKARLSGIMTNTFDAPIYEEDIKLNTEKLLCPYCREELICNGGRVYCIKYSCINFELENKAINVKDVIEKFMILKEDHM